MAEISPGDRVQADHDSFLRRDSAPEKAYRRVHDPDVLSVLNDIAEALGVDTATADPHFNSTSNATTPGTEQTLISETVPAGTIRELSRITTVCRQEATGQIKVDGALIGSFRTGPAVPSGVFEWIPRYPVSAGQEIEVLFTARTGAPISTVDCHLQAVDKST